MKSRSISPNGAVVALVLCLSLLWAAGTPLARADETSRAAKVAELMRLTGLAQMLAESKRAGQAAARKTIQSMSEQMFAKFPAIPAEQRARIEGAGQQFQRDVDNRFDQDDAVRTWGRLYSQNLTDADLDAILAFYRSSTESGTAMGGASTQGVVRAAGVSAAPMTPGPAALPEGSPAPRWDSNPTAPNGLVIQNPPPSERCEVSPPTPVEAHAVPPSGRSLVCVCIDEKGTLSRDPVIAESSGDSRVDSGAVKMARSDSGRYEPPLLAGKPQRACFRFAIDFKHQH